MKKPSLEEVQEYFKNAKEVICLHNGDITNITKENRVSGIRLGAFNNKQIWVDVMGHRGLSLLLYNNGEYAHIVSSVLEDQIFEHLGVEKTKTEWGKFLGTTIGERTEGFTKVSEYKVGDVVVVLDEGNNLFHQRKFEESYEVIKVIKDGRRVRLSDKSGGNDGNGVISENLIRKATPHEEEEYCKNSYKIGDHIIVKTYEESGIDNGIKTQNLVSKLYSKEEVNGRIITGVNTASGEFLVVKEVSGNFLAITRSCIKRKATKEEVEEFIICKLPEINNYRGEVLGCELIYGCARLPVSWFEGSYNREITKITLSSGVEISEEQIKKIRKFLKSI